MKRILYVLILTSLLSSCSGITKECIVGNYYLTASDYSKDDMSLSYLINETGDFIGIIEPTVFELVCDRGYIFIKQNPREFPEAPNRTIVNYYIVPVEYDKNIYSDENTIGPLTKTEFEEKKKELGILNELEFISINSFL